MADIQRKILEKYGIDISKDNIFKLYKIENDDISSLLLEQAISAARKRWNQSINGANEKIAERDQSRLEKADKYEAILRDGKIRKEVYGFYISGKGKSQESDSGSGGSIGFAKEYFQLVSTTKKIKKADVEFFFSYYQSERKNKKAILEMLTKEFKILGLGKEAGYDNEDKDKEADDNGKKKKESSRFIVNLFQEATILKLQRCMELFKISANSVKLCQTFPALRESLYDFLDMKNMKTLDQFSDVVTARGRAIYTIRQEHGTEYVPLLDMFNLLKTIIQNRDVVDNFQEFKLLLRYPTLTPYMYAFVEMKPVTMKGLINVANREYVFRDDADFVLNYYKPVHDNFGILNQGITPLIKRAEKKAKTNGLMNIIDEKLGRSKKRKISMGAEIIHGLIYWPIFMLYFVFELAKLFFTKLHYFVIPVFAVLFIEANVLFPKLFGIDNLLILLKLFSKAEWSAFLSRFVQETEQSGFFMVISSIVAVILLLAIYILPPLLAALFLRETSEGMSKHFDWIGIERSFDKELLRLRKKTEDQYIAQPQFFVKQKVPWVLINLASVIVLCVGVYFVHVLLGT